MTLEILSARSAEQRSRWLELWRNETSQEPFAHPTFVELFAGEHATPMLAHLEVGAGRVVFPFELRPIPSDISRGERDYASPYGYGGPFEEGDAHAASRDFWTQFDAWCRDTRVISGFTRMSLFSQCVPSDGVGLLELFGNVVVNLERTPDEIWEGYARKVRKNVRRARDSGLEVQEDPSGAHLDEFLAIYDATMTRREASSTFFFGRPFFQRIVDEMPGSYTFVHVRKAGDLVSTELVLKSKHYLYSFLGGTLDTAFDMRPNDLLKHYVISLGQERGYRGFVLGGGYGGEDGIFRYKQAFDPAGVVPFRVIRRVVDAARVEQLVADRVRRDPMWTPTESFFPPYRA